MPSLNQFSTIIFACCFFLLSPLVLQADPRFQTAENVDCQVFLNNTHSVRWYGKCFNGKAQGVGTAQYLKDQKILITYKGNMVDGEWHGQGTEVDYEGYKYIGKYKDGLRHGQGTFMRPNNKGSEIKQYTGDWKNDKYHGYGTAIYFNGSKYAGQWVNGKPVGLRTAADNSQSNYVPDNKKSILDNYEYVESTDLLSKIDSADDLEDIPKLIKFCEQDLTKTIKRIFSNKYSEFKFTILKERSVRVLNPNFKEDYDEDYDEFYEEFEYTSTPNVFRCKFYGK